MAKQTFTTGQVLTAAQMTSLQQTAMGGGSTTAKTVSYVLVAADAGTVVQMNSASATTITVNTALFAAGDTVEIQNVGAGVCTVTAGTATVSTSSTLALKQYDAGSLYFNSASAAIFFATDAADSTSPLTTKGDLYTFSTLDARLPVGTNNQTLVADSAEATGLKWATPTAAAFVGVNALRTNVSTVLVANTNITVAFTTEEYDTNSFHDNTTNNSRITIPAGYSGKYQVSCLMNNPTGTPGGYQYMMVYKNGSQYTTGGVREGTYARQPGTANQMFSFSQVVTATAGDYFELQYAQNNGETVNLFFNFQFSYLGA